MNIHNYNYEIVLILWIWVGWPKFFPVPLFLTFYENNINIQSDPETLIFFTKPIKFSCYQEFSISTILFQRQINVKA